MRCCTMSRDIYCLWSASKSSLDAYERWEVLLTTSISHLWVSPCHFLAKWALKLHTKCQMLDTLSVWHIGWCITRKDIHCLWIVSKPPVDAWWGWEDLQTISIHQLWVSPCHFPRQLTIKLLTKYQMLGTLSVQQMRCRCARKDIHCSWSVPLPALDA